MKKTMLFRVAMIATLGLVAAAIMIFIMSRKDPVVIAAIISITGPAGPTLEGMGVRDGLIFAAREINSRGGINGSKIKLVIEDAEINPELGKEIFERIEAEQRPLFYISTHSSVSAAIAPLAQESGVVQMATIASDHRITKGKEWVFRYWPTAEKEVPIIVTMLKELNIKNLGIIYLDDEFGRSVSSLLKEGFQKVGGQADTVSFGIREIDFKEEVERFSGKDAIFSVGFPVHLKPIFKQIREMDYNGVVLSNLAAADTSFHKLEDANGIYITAPAIYNPNFFFARELKKDYEDNFEGEFTHYVAAGYDLLKLLAALLDGEELSRENVKNVLNEGFIHPGVLGNINIAQGEHDISFPLYSAQILDGEVKYRY